MQNKRLFIVFHITSYLLPLLSLIPTPPSIVYCFNYPYIKTVILKT